MKSSIATLVLAPLAAAFVAAVAAPAAMAADALPTLHAAPQRTTVSGLSSGGFMAVQYAVAFSSTVAGVGVVAGGPYNCAWVNLGGIETCMKGRPSGTASWAAAQGFAGLDQIDPVAGLANMRAYVFTGTRDEVVRPPVVAATRDFFAAAGIAGPNLAYVSTVPAGHAFIAPSFGNLCGTNAAPYIDRCTVQRRVYDQPRAILQHLAGPLKPAVTALSTTVVPFDQREFASAATGLDDIGFVYVPKSCRSAAAGACAVHVVFHGCKQGARSVGSDVYGSVGYNRWADANHLIVLYPQVTASDACPMNPEGCWDWWGYTGLNFQLRSGAQLAAVKAMVDRLTTAP
jgi:poly(3-hydroxybutyrate) depolymerase